MDEQTTRKTYKYRLKLTPEQDQMLDRVLMLGRRVYNAAMGERGEAWRMVAHARRLSHVLPAEG